MARAEIQIDNCLIADEANFEAKKIKAFILTQKNQYLQAYDIYKELFEEDPIFYKELLLLSKRVGTDSDQKIFLDRASLEYRKKIKKSSDNVTDWVNSWRNYIDCMRRKKTIEALDDAESAVKGELLKFKDEIAKKVFLEKQLSLIYSDRAAIRGRETSLAEKKSQLSDLTKSIEADDKNVAALQWLTILGTDPVIGDDARKVYDPKFDPNTPWVVLSELGHHALSNKDYKNAIAFFERARQKNPRDPQVLNNLAYAYLVSENRSPEQALLLVDQALSVVRGSRIQNVPEVAASFYDTRGVALMQLERMKEASAAFEVALTYRPESKLIMERLIECYTAIGNKKQAEVIRRRIDRLPSSDENETK